MRRTVDFLRSDDLPYLSKPAFRQERAYYFLWALVLGTVEGNLAGVVAAKTFSASKLLTVIVWALPIVMMSLNLFWGIIIRGRDRKRLFYLLAVGTALFTCSIGLNSASWQPWNGWLFAAQIGLTHFFVTGLVTLRASIWKVNYPDFCRGKIIGRLQNIHFLFVPSSSAIIALLFNQRPEYYRWVYPAAAAIALIALLPLRRFRVRHERTTLKQFRSQSRIAHHGFATRLSGLRAGIHEAASIMRQDVTFRRYMIAQFALGAANFYTDPILLNVITRQMNLSYLAVSLIMTAIPGITAWFAIPYWGTYFDRVGVLRFRLVNCYVWFASFTTVALSMVLYQLFPERIWLTLPFLLLARVIMGAAHGGGVIAWSLGHLHFARKNQVDLYMSIHVGLTGLRALTMPGLNLLLNSLVGNFSFLVTIGLAGYASLSFRKLYIEDRTSAQSEEVAMRQSTPTTETHVT